MNREKQRTRQREKMRRFYARMHADPELYAAFRVKCREYEQRYRDKRKKKLTTNAEAAAALKAKRQAWKKDWDCKERLRKETDACFYALWRAERRVKYAMRRLKTGKLYRGAPGKRIPDWATYCRVVWAESPWLIENVTPSQRAFARELAIERRHT